MSESTAAESNEPTTPDAIEAKLADTRAQMTDTVDELVAQLDPRKQAKEIADKAKVKAGEASDFARETIEKAKDGDSTARTILGGAAGGALLITGLIARRIFKRG